MSNSFDGWDETCMSKLDPAEIGAALGRPAKLLVASALVIANLFLIGAFSAASAAENSESKKGDSRCSSHDYTFRLRGRHFGGVLQRPGAGPVRR